MGDESTAWGWTMQQFLVAWTYFKDQELVYDKALSVDEQIECFYKFLADLQTRWLTEFPCEPGQGPMQIYDPPIEDTRRHAIGQVWARLSAHQMLRGL